MVDLKSEMPEPRCGRIYPLGLSNVNILRAPMRFFWSMPNLVTLWSLPINVQAVRRKQSPLVTWMSIVVWPQWPFALESNCHMSFNQWWLITNTRILFLSKCFSSTIIFGVDYTCECQIYSCCNFLKPSLQKSTYEALLIIDAMINSAYAITVKLKSILQSW